MKIEFQMGQLVEQEIRTRFLHREFPDSCQLGKSSVIGGWIKGTNFILFFSLYLSDLPRVILWVNVWAGNKPEELLLPVTGTNHKTIFLLISLLMDYTCIEHSTPVNRGKLLATVRQEY